MAELKKHTLLLLTLSFLLLAKFIFLPVIDWQNTMISEIQLLEKKSLKVARVIAGQSSTSKTNLTLSKEVERGNKLFYSHQAPSKFKLTQQKMVESLLDKYQLKSQNIGWQTPSELISLQVIRYPLQLRFSGKTLDVIKFIAATETFERNMEVNNFNLSLKRQDDSSLGYFNGKLTLNFYVNSSVKSINHQDDL